MADKLTLEENEQLSAIILSPLMQLIDMAAEMYDTERLRATLKQMDSHASHLAAWPIRETMDKADEVSNINSVFEKFVELVELRTKQKHSAIERTNNQESHQNLLKQLGLS